MHNHRIARALVALTLTAALAVTVATASDTETSPVITVAGTTHAVPNPAYKPDPKATYKVVFAMTAAAKTPDQVNPAIERVARAVNLYTGAGVPVSHLKFVAVAYGAATAVALDDEHYKAAYGVANPNLPVIAQLRKAGVDITVCGQAVREHQYEYGWIDRSVTVALSAITTITSLEQSGYHLMPLP